MKVCPRCKKTYTDDNLNFCLEDGNMLAHASSSSMPETVMMSQPPATKVRQAMPTHQMQQPAAWAAPTQPQYAVSPKKSSKAWLWVVGILGVIVLLCGGGFAGLALIGMNMDKQASENSPRPSNTRSVATAENPATTERSDAETIDLSKWVKDFSVYGTTEYNGSEFIMSSKQKGFYYVLVAPEEYSTSSANTRVSLRNIDDAASSLGYGLIFHSNPTPLTQDYAFLIDTKRKRYRVVRHQPQKETSLVAWTNSPVIKEGSQENVLEARDKGDNTELYINDQLVTTVKNNNAYKNGVPGLYSGDAVKIAFKNLEIRK